MPEQPSSIPSLPSQDLALPIKIPNGDSPDALSHRVTYPNGSDATYILAKERSGINATYREPNGSSSYLLADGRYGKNVNPSPGSPDSKYGAASVDYNKNGSGVITWASGHFENFDTNGKAIGGVHSPQLPQDVANQAAKLANTAFKGNITDAPTAHLANNTFPNVSSQKQTNTTISMK